MSRKMKSLYGIAKKHGKKDFLDAAGYYTCHLRDTVNSTIWEMESRWYNTSHSHTEADKMLEEYNHGICILSQNRL